MAGQTVNEHWLETVMVRARAVFNNSAVMRAGFIILIMTSYVDCRGIRLGMACYIYKPDWR